jgi:hypothetical protein
MNSSSLPSLRYESPQLNSTPRSPFISRQRSKLGCDAQAGLVLKNPRLYDIFELRLPRGLWGRFAESGVSNCPSTTNPRRSANP